MSRRDPPRGVSGLLVAAALALGGAFLVPAPQAQEGREPTAPAACAPDGDAARLSAETR